MDFFKNEILKPICGMAFVVGYFMVIMSVIVTGYIEIKAWLIG